jgi:hypothetical protein
LGRSKKGLKKEWSSQQAMSRKLDDLSSFGKIKDHINYILDKI